VSDTTNKPQGPEGFLVVLPHTIIEIPLSSNLSWLPLFYALPPELVNKRPEYAELPRNINILLSSEAARNMVESDLFVELVWDCYAWSIWQFLKVPLKNGTYRDIPGDWSNYTGHFPLWRLSYYLQLFFRNKFEHEMEFSFQRLFMMPPSINVPWLDSQHFSNLVGNLTDLIVEEQNLQPAIDAIWNNRQVDDYTDDDNYARKDFMKHWTHARSDGGVKAVLSLEKMLETSEEEINSVAYSEDMSGEIVKKISIRHFINGLTHEGKKILQLRGEGKTLREIAAAIGLKSPSAITKRIAKIAEQYKAEVD